MSGEGCEGKGTVMRILVEAPQDRVFLDSNMIDVMSVK